MIFSQWCYQILYVDDTLVLAKPSDFTETLYWLNSFHSQIKLTHEEFTDTVHFLGILIEGDSTSIYRISTHTGQFVHLDSFESWLKKIAWVKSLIFRAHNICSNSQFMSWNGFPRCIAQQTVFLKSTNLILDLTTNTNNQNPQRSRHNCHFSFSSICW